MAELIDVSNVSGSVDWKRVSRAGTVGAWLKATEGGTYVDSRFAENRSSANANGLRTGAYHFARPDLHAHTPLEEARNFVDVVKKLGRRDLRPVLDLEVDKAWDVLHPQELQWWCRKWSHYVKDHLGCWPFIYGSTSYLARLNCKEPILGGLWLASYGPNDGKRHSVVIPHPWIKAVAHQYTSVGLVDGVTGHVDRSYAPRLYPLLAHPLRGLVGGGGRKLAA